MGNKDPQNHQVYRSFLTHDANKPPLPLTRIYPEHIQNNSKNKSEDYDADEAQEKEAKRVINYLLTLLYLYICIYSI
jgi:hypothetical protein